MKKDKAIKILTRYNRYVLPGLAPDEENAIKLGIEALKRCKVLAENNPLWAAKPLPGETK